MGKLGLWVARKAVIEIKVEGVTEMEPVTRKNYTGEVRVHMKNNAGAK